MLKFIIYLLSFQSCEWCGAGEAPPNLSWRTIISSADERGKPLEITGTVYLEDGVTPAKGVLVYVYHTNVEGEYPRKGNEEGNAKRHGYLRGWMKTDEEGRYSFRTIKPAPYQTHGGEPAHIHYTIKPPGEDEYWLTGLWFKDDPRVTKALIDNVPRDGGFGNVTELTLENGILKGRRDIKITSFD